MMSSNKDNKASNVTPLRPARKCPVCHKSASQKFHPFCSARCADVDLNRWLSGAYVIPSSADNEQDEPPIEDE